MRLWASWALVGLLFVASVAAAHTRSESHSVWEIRGADVDLIMTIPVIEANRLANGSNAPTDDHLKTYLSDRVYPIAGERRCALVPPIQTLSAATGFRKYDFTFTCSTANNLQIHSGAF